MDGLRAKKREVSKIRRQSEKHLDDAKSILRRSKSGLRSADRQIESAEEDLSDTLLVLTQKTSQHDSILRLIEGAEKRLAQERDAREQAEQDEEFADSADEKAMVQKRLRGIRERISVAELEIKNRKKMVKVLQTEIDGHSVIKSKTVARIKKATQVRPELRKLIKSSTTDSEMLSKKLELTSRQEANVKKNLIKAEEKLQAQLARKSRRLAAMKKAKRAIKKKPAKTIPAKTISKKKPAKKPAKTIPKRKPAKKTLNKSLKSTKR